MCKYIYTHTRTISPAGCVCSGRRWGGELVLFFPEEDRAVLGHGDNRIGSMLGETERADAHGPEKTPHNFALVPGETHRGQLGALVRGRRHVVRRPYQRTAAFPREAVGHETVNTGGSIPGAGHDVTVTFRRPPQARDIVPMAREGLQQDERTQNFERRAVATQQRHLCATLWQFVGLGFRVSGLGVSG
jgi:hypothetical protein